MFQQKKFLISTIILLCLLGGYGIYTWHFQDQAPSDVVPPEKIIDEKNTLEIPVKTSTEFTLADVAQHARKSSCWTIIDDHVYDLTQFASQHTGGEIEILKICGKDATHLFGREHGNETKPTEVLERYRIGSYLDIE